MYKLIIQDDEGKTTVVPLIREEFTIGRQAGNTIRLTERNVSRRHAKLLRVDKEIVVQDLDSYNGVRVNGARIEGRITIKEFDRVQIGDYLIEVKADKPNDDAKTMEMEVLTNVPVLKDESSSEASTVPNIIGKAITTPAPDDEDTSGGDATRSTVSANDIKTKNVENGRLVILSASMAGREFDLDKPAMVIGRTEENDIWVNHRSISRHHAKVIRENGNYAVVDLQSANGVRVNGEEYGKVELRKGDVIDLGHVRFRFVAPGEDFLFGRDAQAVSIVTEDKARMGLWILLLALVMVGIGAYFYLTNQAGRGDTETKEPVVNIASTVVSDAVSPPEVTEKMPKTSDATVRNVSPELVTFLEEAEQSLEVQNWDATRKAAMKALSIDSNNVEAKNLLEQSRQEIRHSEDFSLFQIAVKDRKWANVAATYAEIDSDSFYKSKASPDHQRLKSEFTRYQLQLATKVAKKNKCSELEQIALKVPAQWSDIADIVRETSCDSKAKKNQPIKTIDPVVPKNSPSVDELNSQSAAAIKDTQFGKGLRLCRQALKVAPHNEKAAIFCGVASCNLKNGVAAKKYMRKIKSQTRRALIRQVCLTQNVPGFEFDTK